MGATDTTTVEVEAAPTETIAPNTATVLPEPYADGWNDDKARVTIQAYFKVR
jgi:hypothetical protein